MIIITRLEKVLSYDEMLMECRCIITLAQEIPLVRRIILLRTRVTFTAQEGMCEGSGK